MCGCIRCCTFYIKPKAIFFASFLLLECYFWTYINFSSRRIVLHVISVTRNICCDLVLYISVSLLLSEHTFIIFFIHRCVTCHFPLCMIYKRYEKYFISLHSSWYGGLLIDVYRKWLIKLALTVDCSDISQVCVSSSICPTNCYAL